VRRRVVTILSAAPVTLSLVLCWMSVRGGLLGPGEGFTREVVRPGRLDRMQYGFRTMRRGFEFASKRWSYADPAMFERYVVRGGRETRTWGGSELRPEFTSDVHPRLEALGFAFGNEQRAVPAESFSGWAFRLPYWVLAAAMLLAHGAVMARGLRLQRSLDWRKVGRCAACGYDLRASAARCPECGADAVPAEGATA
jgi:hypothetical protein